MTVHLLRYRPWRGTLRGPSSAIWPIARVALQTMFRRKLFWATYALGLMLFLFFFFGQYVLAWASSQAGDQEVRVVGGMRENPRVLVKQLGDNLKLNGKDVTFANFFWYQGYTVMMILALAGSLLIGNDIQYGSLPFYLAKPISSWHYLLGKGLAIAVFINMMTTIPALLLYVEYGLLEEGYLFQSWHLVFGILGYGLILTLCLTLILMAAATWLRRTVPLIMGWATLFVFCRFLANVLVDRFQYPPRVRLIDLWNSMYVLGAHCLQIPRERINPVFQPRWYEASLFLGLICLICLTYLIRRVRAVEIIR
ncbi:MAG TPA: ABC transporter permease subunit [Gemmataceae bacterium]|nr:ABC transporter permease subunit [Gemmataceae bacterium]